MSRYLNTALVAATIGGTLFPVQTTHGRIVAVLREGVTSS
jgi:hypothetical protein